VLNQSIPCVVISVTAISGRTIDQNHIVVLMLYAILDYSTKCGSFYFGNFGRRCIVRHQGAIGKGVQGKDGNNNCHKFFHRFLNFELGPRDSTGSWHQEHFRNDNPKVPVAVVDNTR